jgi:undecaprenyl-diphosphatase
MQRSLDRYLTLIKPLLAGLVVVVLALAFAYIGSEAVEGETHGFDLHVVHSAQALRSVHPWLAEVLRDFSGLGSTAVLTLFTVSTVCYLAFFSARVTALLVASSVISGTLLVSLFKGSFGRLRPDARLADMVVPGLSFPSGHASMSAIVFLTIGALIASTRSRLNERAFILTTAALMTLLVGLSRVGLGVHWASDVLGGWAFGAAWAMVWLLLARWLLNGQRN